MPSSPTLLAIGDRLGSLQPVFSALEAKGWIIRQEPPEAVAESLAQSVRAILLQAPERLPEVQAVSPGAKVFVLIGESPPEAVLESLRSGAYCLFPHPADPRAISEIIQQCAERAGWEGELELVSGTPQWFELQVGCRTKAVERLLSFLRALLSDVPEDRRDAMTTALREVLLNAIEHGANLDPAQRVRLTCLHTSRFLQFVIRDPGSGFSWDDLPHAAISNPPDQPMQHIEYRNQSGLRPGGFGILLVRNLVDELVYNDKGNEVCLIQYLDQPKTGT